MASETFTFYVQPWYRKSPYFESTKRHGCKSWGLYNHMLLPTLYDDPVTEYRALLNDVTLWDVARRAMRRDPRARRVRAANLITCRDLTKVAVMQARYVLLTAPWGGIVNDPVLLRLAEDRFWLALADSDALLYVAGRRGARAGWTSRSSRPTSRRCRSRGRGRKDVVRDLFGDAVAGPPLLLLRRGRGRRHPASSSPGRDGPARWATSSTCRTPTRGDDLFERVVPGRASRTGSG